MIRDLMLHHIRRLLREEGFQGQIPAGLELFVCNLQHLIRFHVAGNHQHHIVQIVEGVVAAI